MALSSPSSRVPLSTIAREWGRIGVTGFGGPPVHIALLRTLCVREREWMDVTEFEDAISAVNLLPGPASTQLALYTAWFLRGVPGALVAAATFILPGTVAIVLLSALFLQSHPPLVVLGAAAAMGAVVPVVALQAARVLAGPSWSRVSEDGGSRLRWATYALAGALGALALGPWLVVVILLAGLVEVVVRRSDGASALFTPLGVVSGLGAVGGLGALVVEALKVGALSYGGGFVIIPLMQHDTVTVHHWMTGVQFSNAVALGQITPGPVVQTVAVVGYAAAGYLGAALATVFAFSPSLLFVVAGGPHFARLRANQRAQQFLSGAGAASIGAIGGSALTLATPLHHLWQWAVTVVALGWLVGLRRSTVVALVVAAALGVVAALAGAPLPH